MKITIIYLFYYFYKCSLINTKIIKTINSSINNFLQILYYYIYNVDIIKTANLIKTNKACRDKNMLLPCHLNKIIKYANENKLNKFEFYKILKDVKICIFHKS